MENKFTLAWSFRNRKEVLFKSIQTAHETCPLFVDFCLVDAASDSEMLKSLRNFCNKIEGRRIRICESTYRSSLAEAWNLCLMLTENRYVIFASSDVIFLKEGWLQQFMIGLKQSPYVLMNNHAVFCLDKKNIISKVGWFDESYLPGPHFDPDLMIRASEAQIDVINIGNHNYYIHGDEKDLDVAKDRCEKDHPDRLPMHNFHNEDYFKSKWKSPWPGWKEAIKNKLTHKPHPPVHINQVTRQRSEVDPHPLYTNKIKGE